MIRLHFVVEGQTEEAVVNSLLVPHLTGFSIVADVHCVTTSRQEHRIHRGGFNSYAQVRRDLDLWRKQDKSPECRFTTMVDLYRLPKDFPGLASSASIRDPFQRVNALEAAFADDLADWRFVPYIQLHEFEALLFCGLEELCLEFPDARDAIERLKREVSWLSSPEEIDDGGDTSPSKRIIRQIPKYEGRKSSVGPLVAAAIGLDTLRQKCPHFQDWLNRIETLALDAG